MLFSLLLMFNLFLPKKKSRGTLLQKGVLCQIHFRKEYLLLLLRHKMKAERERKEGKKIMITVKACDNARFKKENKNSILIAISQNITKRGNKTKQPLIVYQKCSTMTTTVTTTKTSVDGYIVSLLPSLIWLNVLRLF